jgi:hypothetical protein
VGSPFNCGRVRASHLRIGLRGCVSAVYAGGEGNGHILL